MKKINSIHVATKVLGVILFFMMILPLCFWGMEQLGIISRGSPLIHISLIIGGSLAVGAFLLLVMELRQDRQLDVYFMSHRNQKLMLQNDLYECQNCGNKLVNEADTYCKVCGIIFKEYQDKPPYL